MLYIREIIPIHGRIIQVSEIMSTHNIDYIVSQKKMKVHITIQL